MLKHLIIALATLSSLPSIAQDGDNSEPTNHRPRPCYNGSELIVGHGFLPGTQLNAGEYNGMNYDNESYTGALFATYRYHIGRVISLGIGVAYERESGSWGAGPGYILYLNSQRFTRNSFTFAPEITFNYGESANGLVKIYSVLGIGYTIGNQVTTVNGQPYYSHLFEGGSNEATRLRANAYVSPIGVRFGRRLGGFAELGFGYKGIFNYGMTYRF